MQQLPQKQPRRPIHSHKTPILRPREEEIEDLSDEFEETFDPTPQTLMTWEAQEYDKVPRTRNWYIGVYVLFIGLVSYALFTDNLLMAVVFILFAVVLYLFETKDPRMIKFSITTEGVIAQSNLYEFENLDSFWIFYYPNEHKILSLKSKKKYLPYIHIPLGPANPVEIRKILLAYIIEEKQQEGLVDAIEKFF